MEPFSIFIPCAQKDLHKLPFLLDSVKKNLIGWDDIHIVAPDASMVPKHPMIRMAHSERAVLDIDTSKFRWRPRWIYQQFLKLFQNVTKHDLFLTIDADVVFLKPMPLFDNGKRIWWRGWEQNHRPYYEFMERVFGFGREYDGTFLCDMNFLDRSILRRMIGLKWFYEKTVENLGRDCYPSEADIFGQYVHKHFPGLYEVRQARTVPIGQIMQSWDHNVWPEAMIRARIESAKDSGADMVMLHSWAGEIEKKECPA